MCIEYAPTGGEKNCESVEVILWSLSKTPPENCDSNLSYPGLPKKFNETLYLIPEPKNLSMLTSALSTFT